MAHFEIDVRITKLIKDVIISHHRSMFFIYGEKSRDQVLILHHLLKKNRLSLNSPDPYVLWCYKRQKEFYRNYLTKRLKQLKKAYALRLCHYSETETVLGQTFGMLIIQDFQALTPNILARIIECVEGGMIIFLLPNIASLEDLFLLNMDVHSRWVNEVHTAVNPIFNKRFVLSLASCENCLVLDDTLNIKLLPKAFDSLPKQVHNKNNNSKNIIKAVSKSSLSEELKKVLALCVTLDQLHSLEKIYEVLKERKVLSIVSLTSARGRGKSAILGLAIAIALASDYSKIFVTSPHLENLQTFFNFLTKGLASFGHKKGVDYTVEKCQENPYSFTHGVNIFNNRHKSVRYLSPVNFQEATAADLIVIDEAAAIPLPIVKKWMASCSVLMASTINGYEGTGRSLSLKLLNQLRNQSVAQAEKSHILHEIQLNEAVRYANGDGIESWLNGLLCLNATMDSLSEIFLEPPKCEDCDLYYVNRDTLFSYNKFAEEFLQKVMSLFVSSHYKNSPNDLLMIADAPAHHIFCLLPRMTDAVKTPPKVLCVIQVCLEGKINADNYAIERNHGKRAAGDLVPWVISQQFQDYGFCSLSGARIIRIATHPHYQRMGYGQCALELLSEFYSGSLIAEGKSINSTSEEKGKKYLYFAHYRIYNRNLWITLVSAMILEKKNQFIPFYLRQSESEVTGEHSCIMIKNLKKGSPKANLWLTDCYTDFLERFASFLITAFKHIPSSLALNIFQYADVKLQKDLTLEQLQWFLSPRSVQRIHAYSYLGKPFLSYTKESVLVCFGMQDNINGLTNQECQHLGSENRSCKRKEALIIQIFLVILRRRRKM
ncbi:RNA cytidine acetyltransferase [Caerostris extrusa]|uniref:RNA cytidine acetyltransferase n=1 Tax=Caerostris extrusa TaxID=172846 RepID=A0AAV4SGU0_CAEEX|nr:RNA cytidine acetyltransferase [Caerostris extrusa]